MAFQVVHSLFYCLVLYIFLLRKGRKNNLFYSIERKCKPICWEEIGVWSFDGPSIITNTSEKVNLIIDRLKIVRNRQKSYEDLKRRDLEFKVGDKVFLKVSPIRGTIKFG